MIGKIFEGEMLITTLATTLLDILFESILYFQAIIKSIQNTCDRRVILKLQWVNICDMILLPSAVVVTFNLES